jgi:hypothetical protein
VTFSTTTQTAVGSPFGWTITTTNSSTVTGEEPFRVASSGSITISRGPSRVISKFVDQVQKILKRFTLDWVAPLFVEQRRCLLHPIRERLDPPAPREPKRRTCSGSSRYRVMFY